MMANNSHVEGVLAGRYTLPDIDLAITFGGGTGFMKGYGNTKFRIFAGVQYAPKVILDADGDGILDDDDKCPFDPEDFDGFQDEDGCPDPDNDGDGIPDIKDKCPNDPEDLDGFEDEDGCPDPDNDGDGIPDELDECPNEPETFNGHDDEDGCPDVAPKFVLLKRDRLELLDKVFFDTGDATLPSRSHELLNEVAGILLSKPSVTKLRIEGHTDSQGSETLNIQLSQARAEAVRDYLLRQGVATERLEVKGFGPSVPVAPNDTAEGREANRRVEFNIVMDVQPPPAD